MTHRPWTPAEDAIMDALYATHTAEQIARKLGRTAGSVECRRKCRGLCKSQVKRREPKPERLERLECDPSREAIEAAVNAIRAGLGLGPCVWPETKGAEEQLTMWENVA